MVRAVGDGALSAPTAVVLNAALPPGEVVPGFKGLPDLRVGQADDSCGHRKAGLGGLRSAEPQGHPPCPHPEPMARRGAWERQRAPWGRVASPPAPIHGHRRQGSTPRQQCAPAPRFHEGIGASSAWARWVGAGGWRGRTPLGSAAAARSQQGAPSPSSTCDMVDVPKCGCLQRSFALCSWKKNKSKAKPFYTAAYPPLHGGGRQQCCSLARCPLQEGDRPRGAHMRSRAGRVPACLGREETRGPQAGGPHPSASPLAASELRHAPTNSLGCTQLRGTPKPPCTPQDVRGNRMHPSMPCAERARCPCAAADTGTGTEQPPPGARTPPAAQDPRRVQAKGHNSITPQWGHGIRPPCPKLSQGRCSPSSTAAPSTSSCPSPSILRTPAHAAALHPRVA